ncbi:MAG: histidinol-phosphate transaminase [Pirellulales bacterium]|nr:histidinol-phosphate transaminase [Pirellulales bacterium]
MSRFVRPHILRMEGYVPGEQPQGGKFIKLNTNENPYPPSAAVARAVQAVLERGLQRYPDPLATAFRQRAADLLGLHPDWILCGNGSDELLTIVTRALLAEGDRLRLPYPSYILYHTLAEIQGAAAEEVWFAADWSLPPAFAAAAERLKLVFLPNPNSPSGTVLPPESVLELARALPCPLVLDEAYVDFASSNCLELVRECDNVVVTRSLSKSYALAGLRFGYLIARPDLVHELIKVKDSYNCDALSIAAATAALDDQAWLARTRAAIIATRERMAAELRRLGFEVAESQANFVWATHATRPVQPLYEGLKAQGVLVRYMNYPGWGDGLRISVGTDSQVDTCLGLLRDLL